MILYFEFNVGKRLATASEDINFIYFASQVQRLSTFPNSLLKLIVYASQRSLYFNVKIKHIFWCYLVWQNVSFYMINPFAF